MSLSGREITGEGEMRNSIPSRRDTIQRDRTQPQTQGYVRLVDGVLFCE